MKLLLIFLALFPHFLIGILAQNSSIRPNNHLNKTNVIQNETLLVLHDSTSTCMPNQNEHPINLTANCAETRFPLHFENYSEFSAAIEFDSKTCVGQVELNITLNGCHILLTKADIPGGSVVVVNKETHNLVPGNRVLLTLSDDNLLIQSTGRQFQMKSNCHLLAKRENVLLDTIIKNSDPVCHALISLDSSAKFYGAPTFWQVLQNNLAFLIVTTLIILLCILLLVLMVCLWRLNSLPGTRLVSPRTGRYTPKSIEDNFSNAYPVHFKPHEEATTRSSQTVEVHHPLPAVTVEKFEPNERQQIKL